MPSVDAGTWSGVRPSRARRVLDIAVSLAGLAVFGVPLLALMLAIRCESRGSALFRQVRVGQGRHEFRLLKLRSMRVDSAGSELTARCDPRITRLGRLVRATSMDELPQLVNVLRGDMTLVGPRPETPALAVGLSARVPVGLRVPAGIDRTGAGSPARSRGTRRRCGVGGVVPGSDRAGPDPDRGTLPDPAVPAGDGLRPGRHRPPRPRPVGHRPSVGPDPAGPISLLCSGSHRAFRQAPLRTSNSKLCARQRSTPPSRIAPTPRSSPACGQ